MARSTTESEDALTRMTHIVASGMTTTVLSGEEPTSDSTGSDSERNEFMDMDSSSKNQSCILRFEEDWFGPDFSGSLPVRIVEKLGPGIYRVELMASSSDGSTGPSREEAESFD